jgi:hypothetical protein
MFDAYLNTTTMITIEKTALAMMMMRVMAPMTGERTGQPPAVG